MAIKNTRSSNCNILVKVVGQLRQALNVSLKGVCLEGKKETGGWVPGRKEEGGRWVPRGEGGGRKVGAWRGRTRKEVGCLKGKAEGGGWVPGGRRREECGCLQ